MKITAKIPAPENSLFTEEALIGLVGQDTMMFNENSAEKITAKIVGAKVSDDGKTATLTLEIPDA